jgi:hypothetical protein
MYVQSNHVAVIRHYSRKDSCSYAALKIPPFHLFAGISPERSKQPLTKLSLSELQPSPAPLNGK